jgi:hypothetical protein
MTDTEIKQIALRLTPELVAAIDARAKDVGKSRQDWVERSLRWVIQSLPVRASVSEAHHAALTAPYDVAGNKPVDMGLDRPDGKAKPELSIVPERATPPDGHWHRRTQTPVAFTGTERIYGCTANGCMWAMREQIVADAPKRLMPGT